MPYDINSQFKNSVSKLSEEAEEYKKMVDDMLTNIETKEKSIGWLQKVFGNN